jgi:uncharacterized protein DUF6979
MSKYAEIAVRAARRAQQEQISPRDAWEHEAARAFPSQPASVDKGCPKSSFLGLCSLGLVEGIPCGNYTSSKKNRSYAVRIAEILRVHPELISDVERIWMLGTAPASLQPNGQVDVVSGLAREGLLIGVDVTGR